jgi:ABC-type protease/lipase transport system fused ATPase/permease subunit
MMTKPDSVAPALRNELKQFSAVAVKVLLFSVVLNLLVLTVPIVQCLFPTLPA